MNKILIGICWVISFLSLLCPRRLWAFMGRNFGNCLYYILGSHRRYAQVNIRFAFGDDLPEKEMKKIAKESFGTVGMMAFDVIRSMRFVYTSIENEKKYVSYEGLEHYEKAKEYADGKGILLINAHFGMFEHANLFYRLKTDRKLNFILRKMDSQFAQEVLTIYNKKFGIKHFIKDQGMLPVLKGLKRGEDLMIFPDQAANRSEGVTVKLFSKNATTISIVPTLAIKTGCPILPMFLIRGEDQISQKLVFLPPIIAGDDDTVESLTQKQNDAIEEAVRMAPNHWLWLHRRWKQDYPEIYKKK